MKTKNKNKLCRSTPALKTGIVHLGLGAFFRAHSAIYIKEAMAHSGGDWGVVGVSMRSPGVRDKLVKQGCLYTALELSKQGLKSQVVDVVTSVLFAPEDPNTVLREMAAETTRIVSLTITEKGYCRGGGDTALDLKAYVSLQYYTESHGKNRERHPFMGCNFLDTPHFIMGDLLIKKICKNLYSSTYGAWHRRCLN